jgi:glucose dehydrogenase
MDLGKLVRDEEDRSVRNAALVAALLGLATLIGGMLSLGTSGGSAGVVVVIGLVQLGLAFGLYRGSRACAVAVLALFVVDRAVTVLAAGRAGLGFLVWTVIFGALLYGGMRGTFAKNARKQVRPLGS